MRAKHILNQLSIGSKLKIVYERITLTWFTKTFVFVALAHCLVQIALQTTAYSFNTRASDTVSRVIRESGVQLQYAFVKDGELYVCSGLPMSGDPFDSVCWAFAGPGVAPPTNSTAETDVAKSDSDSYSLFESTSPEIGSRDLTAVPISNGSGAVVGVNVTGLNGSAVTELSTRCINALNWPSIILHDARREDISFLFFQIWLLGISVVTILNESIPHLVAALVTHAMSTAWGAFQVSRTGRYARLYQTLIVNDSCSGVDIIPDFWSRRMDYFIPILVLNVLAFVVSLGVSLKLFNIYARQTFKRVGASRELNVLYLCVLLFSVFLQLSAFFTICGSALWIDALSNGVIEGKVAYRVTFIVACVVEFPWVIMGWISIRREHHSWSLVFLIVGLAISAAWTSMFANVVYKWTFQNFPFFATLTITGFIVLVITVVLALICRLHFGKGLPEYLKTEETFDDSSFIPVIVLKKRQSKLVSVIFPDKRTSAARKSVDEKRSFTLDPYKRRGAPAQSVVESVIDIKAPSLHPSERASDTTSIPSAAAASDGHTNDSTGANADANASLDSLLARARAPFLRLSDGSRLGRMSLRFSTFTSSSSSTDLERGVPDVPGVPGVPGVPDVPVPRLPTSDEARDSLATRSGPPPPAPAVPEPIRLAPTVSRSSSTSSGSTSTLSSSTRAAHLPPTINIIPASASPPRSFAMVEQGDLVRAASETSGSRTRMGTTPETRPRSETRSLRGSPPGRGSVGLPRNPRAFRS